MTHVGIHMEALETLKSFNTAVTAYRVYPATAPQVQKAVEAAFKEMNKFLRKYKQLSLGQTQAGPVLCGVAVAQENVLKVKSLGIYQRLEMLHLPYVVFTPGFDRFKFNQIVKVFTFPREKIIRDGGGRAVVTGLELDAYFPVEPPAGPKKKVEKKTDNALPEKQFVISEVKPEYLEYLFGNINDALTGGELERAFVVREKAVNIITAGVARILKDIQKNNLLSRSADFATLMREVDAILSKRNRHPVALESARFISSGLKVPALLVLLIQHYPEGFGDDFYGCLIGTVDDATFQEIITTFRTLIQKLSTGKTKDLSQISDIEEAYEKCIATPRGKQFVGAEKVQAIIEDGEKERLSKRVHTGLQALLQGNGKILHNTEIVQYLPGTVERLLENGKESSVAVIVGKLAEELLADGTESQKHLFKSSCLMAEHFVGQKRWDWLKQLTEPFIQWIENSDDGDAVYVKIVDVLQAVMVHCWQAAENDHADQILVSFYKIRSGTIEKSAKTQEIVSRKQDASVDKDLLPIFLEESLEDPENEILSRRLTMQGPAVARFMIETLLRSEKSLERLKIIDLLTMLGPELAPIVMERLQDPMPWYGKRNLIKLLGDSGNEEHVDVVVGFLGHSDFRVQREAFGCIYKISGERRKDVLLEILPQVSETMKIQVIRALAPFGGNDVAELMADLLSVHQHFSEQNLLPLIREICRAMGQSGSAPAIKMLQEFLNIRGNRAVKHYPNEVWQEASSAILQLKKHQEKLRKERLRAKELNKKTINQTLTRQRVKLPSDKVVTDYPEERQVAVFLGQEKKGKAKGLLVSLIERATEDKKFDQAEALRQWLIEIDPLALTEIIRAAELIEEAKTSSIDNDHLDVWAELYELLSTEEFNAFYYALDHRKFSNEESLVRHGAKLANLFFINSGKIKLFFQEKGSEVLVKTLGRGQVIGSGTFFEASVWTVDVASIGVSEISILDVDKLNKWVDDFPGLESKLRDFCGKFKTANDFFVQTGKDRRRYARYTTTGRVSTVLLDNQGKETGVGTKGDLSDISLGGISFFSRISQKKNARLLLGREIKILFPLESGFGKELSIQGTILAVRAQYSAESEYSVHIKFTSPIDQETLRKIIYGK